MQEGALVVREMVRSVWLACVVIAEQLCALVEYSTEDGDDGYCESEPSGGGSWHRGMIDFDRGGNGDGFCWNDS